MVAAVALGQNQSPPVAPRTQSPAQDGAQPGGTQSSQPAAGQPGQQGNINQGGTQQQGGQQQGDQRQGGQQQSGQRPSGQRTANYRGESANTQSSQAIEGHLAACLILGNQEEVAMGKFAGEHASSDKVKKFAKQMVEDHTKAISQLKQYAPQGANLELSSSGSSSQARDQLTSASQNNSDSAGQQMLAIMRDVKQECLNMTQKELGEKHGEEFDHAYVGQQMGAHLQMIASLTAFEKHASPELQRIVTEQRKSAEEHFDHLKQMIETTGSKSAHNN